MLRAADRYAYEIVEALLYCSNCLDRGKGDVYTPGARPATSGARLVTPACRVATETRPIRNTLDLPCYHTTSQWLQKADYCIRCTFPAVKSSAIPLGCFLKPLRPAVLSKTTNLLPDLRLLQVCSFPLQSRWE